MITAKIKCTGKEPAYNGCTTLRFEPDYHDGRNKAWAVATPSLSLSMAVKDDVADRFELGTPYTLTFTETED